MDNVLRRLTFKRNAISLLEIAFLVKYFTSMNSKFILFIMMLSLIACQNKALNDLSYSSTATFEKVADLDVNHTIYGWQGLCSYVDKGGKKYALLNNATHQIEIYNDLNDRFTDSVSFKEHFPNMDAWDIAKVNQGWFIRFSIHQNNLKGIENTMFIINDNNTVDTINFPSDIFRTKDLELPVSLARLAIGEEFYPIAQIDSFLLFETVPPALTSNSLIVKENDLPMGMILNTNSGTWKAFPMNYPYLGDKAMNVETWRAPVTADNEQFYLAPKWESTIYTYNPTTEKIDSIERYTDSEITPDFSSTTEKYNVSKQSELYGYVIWHNDSLFYDTFELNDSTGKRITKMYCKTKDVYFKVEPWRPVINFIRLHDQLYWRVMATLEGKDYGLMKVNINAQK